MHNLAYKNEPQEILQNFFLKWDAAGSSCKIKAIENIAIITTCFFFHSYCWELLRIGHVH